MRWREFSSEDGSDFWGFESGDLLAVMKEFNYQRKPDCLFVLALSVDYPNVLEDFECVFSNSNTFIQYTELLKKIGLISVILLCSKACLEGLFIPVRCLGEIGKKLF